MTHYLEEAKKPEEKQKKFVKDQVLETRSLCDYNSLYTATVVSRTDKMVVILFRGEKKRCKIHLDAEGVEFIFPLGRYSMSPTFRACKYV